MSSRSAKFFDGFVRAPITVTNEQGPDMSHFRQTSKPEHVLSCLTQLMGLFLAAAALNLAFMPRGKAGRRPSGRLREG